MDTSGLDPCAQDMIRIILVDDQALIRSGFRLILEGEDDFEVVGEAADGEEAVSLSRRLEPDVVLMDIRMPRLDGVEATKRVVAETKARVLILTTFDLDEYVFSAVRAGASGFLLKDVSSDELVNAVRVVAGGDGLIEPRMTRRLLLEFAKLPARKTALPSAMKQLTEREVEVLMAVAQGLSNAEIADQLFIGETTVKTHVTHILTKLQLRDRVQAVVLAYESGLLDG